MNANLQLPEDDKLLELLEHPELWPEDPAVQAELAQLLELHLAMAAHGEALAPAVLPQRRWMQTWMPAAAAVLLVVGPAAYAIHNLGQMKSMAENRARIDEAAQKRAQDRAWGTFFQQASVLVQEFQHNPPSCERGEEDRRVERETAVALLEASHQLAAQGGPIQGAESTRTDLHAWLSEIALEDGCLTPERDKELRRYAMDRGLDKEAERMSRLLQGGGQ